MCNINHTFQGRDTYCYINSLFVFVSRNFALNSFFPLVNYSLIYRDVVVNSTLVQIYYNNNFTTLKVYQKGNGTSIIRSVICIFCCPLYNIIYMMTLYRVYLTVKLGHKVYYTLLDDDYVLYNINIYIHPTAYARGDKRLKPSH